MHIAFLTNPASGEVNVQLATAQELVDQGHSVTFLSTAACSSKVSRFRVAQLPCNQHRIHFISLGSSQALNDFTRMAQSRMHLMRRVPGDPISLQTCTDASVGPAEDHAAMAIRVRDLLNELDPDMICVDALTSSVITGARLTKRKFILTVPCSPGMTALRSAFQPHMVAANRRGSWGTFFENMYLNLHEVIHSRRHPYRREQHKVIKRLGLRSYGTARDSACVGPNWQDENCVAGIHFNTPGLIDCPKQSPKMVFVGAGVAAEHSPSPFTPPPTMPPTPSMDPVGAFPELAWMDEAAARGEDVVYLNMGSMFLWQPDEFDACIEGFKAAHKRLNGRVRFLFKINRPPQSRSSTAKTASNTTPEKEKENTAERELSIEDLDLTLPPFIRLTHWISNQTAVYTHRALKAFIHHGGGNSFNEAVHFAVPQLVLSQWLDTHEYASYAQKFGLGLRSEHPPSVQACDLEAKILELLGPRWAEFKATCQAWALRSELGGGPAAAARIVLFHAQLCAAEAGARRKQSGDGSGSGSGSSTETELTPPLSPEQVSGFGKDVKEIAIS